MKLPTRGSTRLSLPSIWSTRNVREIIRVITHDVKADRCCVEDGTNIDNWTFEDLKIVVAEFVADAMQSYVKEEGAAYGAE